MKYITNIISKLLLFTLMTFTAPTLWAAGEFVVVIDAGHGGKDHGAAANGLSEKDINLGVAKKLETYLHKNVKGVKVIMTRDRDEFLSLQKRADIANKAHADLFISIHTNSVDENHPNRENVAGASTHVLGPSKDEKNLEVARRENSVIKAEKNYKQTYENFDPDSDESYIIFEMVQKKNLQQSIDFALMVQKSLYDNAGRRNRGVHQNGFWVLWATSMPSVLVELDFICNPNSAKFLGSSQGQTELAKGIGEAVKTYVEKVTNVAQVPAVQEEQAAPIVGDYAELTAAPVIDDRTVGTAPKSAKHNTPVKRRRRSDAAKERSEKRVVETDEIKVTTETPQPVLTAGTQATPAAKQTSSPVVSQSVSPTDKPKANNSKSAKNNRPGQQAGQLAQNAAEPAKTGQGQQTADIRPSSESKKANRDQEVKKKDNKPKRSDKQQKNSGKTVTTKPAGSHVKASGLGGKIVNVKKPRLNL